MNQPLLFEKIENIEIRQLLSMMLDRDPTKRPRTSDIIENPWLTRNGGDPIDLDLSSISGSETFSLATMTEKQTSKS